MAALNTTNTSGQRYTAWGFRELPKRDSFGELERVRLGGGLTEDEANRCALNAINNQPDILGVAVRKDGEEI